MAYTAVPTVATGDSWSAKQMNTYVRDNFATGIPDIFTTKGDIAAATSASQCARVAAGSNGNLLFADSTETAGVIFATINHFQAESAGSTQSFAQNTWTLVTRFSVENFDTGAAFASNRFSPTHPGYYIVSVNTIILATLAEGEELKLAIYKNGSLYSILAVVAGEDAATSFNHRLTGMDLIFLDGNDYLEIYVYSQGTGSSVFQYGPPSAEASNVAIGAAI